MTDHDYQALYDEVYKELVTPGLRKKLRMLTEHAQDPAIATLKEQLAKITRERDEARETLLRGPLTTEQVQEALNQGRIERKCAEGDHAWRSLVNRNAALTEQLVAREAECDERQRHTLLAEAIATEARLQLAECERERDTWRTKHAECTTSLITADRQLAIVRKQVDEMIAVNDEQEKALAASETECERLRADLAHAVSENFAFNVKVATEINEARSSRDHALRETAELRAGLERCIESRRNEANIQQVLVKQRHEAEQETAELRGALNQALDIASDYLCASPADADEMLAVRDRIATLRQTAAGKERGE